MALRSYKNKAIKSSDKKVKTKDMSTYMFPGEGKNRPVSIEASSREEAEKKYNSINNN